jgi:hypothetical protein
LRRRAAAHGGELTDEDQTRSVVHDWARGLHQSVACGTGKHSGVIAGSARRIRAAGQLRWVLLGAVGHGNVNKRHRHLPHLHAKILEVFPVAERLRRRRSAAATRS